jgi:hypothetical protein
MGLWSDDDMAGEEMMNVGIGYGGVLLQELLVFDGKFVELTFGRGEDSHGGAPLREEREILPRLRAEWR